MQSQGARKMPVEQPLESLTSQQMIGHLRLTALFVDIKDTPGALEALAQKMRIMSFQPNETIITEGEVKSEMYFLMDGHAAVYKSTLDGEQYKVAIVDGKTHSFFGEGGLLESDSRSATIKAESRCKCLVLSRADFEIFGRANPQWAFPILQRIARAVLLRLKKTNNDLMLLYNALISEIRGH